jgi:hypothetical protein
MVGEFRNLLFRQLITTPYGDGCWAELFHDSSRVCDPITEGVLDEIELFLDAKGDVVRHDFLTSTADLLKTVQNGEKK